ncbi:1-aminocyclopropane-1-carboxylate [Aspergillus oryzae 100-8]|uniref:1-aminocyclopropane-1-carboxylate synthase n=1 Tax=Aspergillus oryzae (strain 3.042) TaxID=1160506 RepID=I8IRB9_ASPO3|nr:1-aminocyclopropane-1-carboxylate synthase [Aspergillus oryzae 3.042]KDE84329.1 1-aminocyclopropane-1-carboxylate [Aspergillus oryzae 100-8]|eukprot:EIT81926.1 1-aminocyclopropane-1-carboxylate synthase [Aspergillus oryzae 3.042]
MCSLPEKFTVDSHSLTYGDGFSGSHRLRDTIARFITRYFNPVNPVIKNQQLSFPGSVSWTKMTASCLRARTMVRAKIIGVSFGEMDPFGPETVGIYEKALADAQRQGIRVKAVLLCNPQNPLGRCYTREVLEAYMRFCQKQNLHLIADEIYALSTWKNPDFPNAPSFTSVLSVKKDGLIDPSLVHALWGMSKVRASDFGSNGIRLGCVISQDNVNFLRAAEANSYFSCPSSLSDLATSRILSDDAWVQSFIQTNRQRLAENYTITIRFLESHQIPYKKGGNVGFFVWVDLFDPIRRQVNATLKKQAEANVSSENAARALETKLQEKLLKHRIFLALGADFGGDVPGWYRIVFAHEKEYLRLGLNRMINALGVFREELDTGLA